MGTPLVHNYSIYQDTFAAHFFVYFGDDDIGVIQDCGNCFTAQISDQYLPGPAGFAPRYFDSVPQAGLAIMEAHSAERCLRSVGTL